MASTHGYVTAADIKRLIPDINQSDNFDTDTEVETFISEAEEVVNSKLSVRYSVPFISVPDIIKYVTARIAVYNILIVEYTGDSLTENVWVDKYKESMNMLDDIINRKMKLVDGAGEDLTEIATIESTHGDYTPIFDVDDATDYEVDPDYLDDIEEQRD